MAVKQLTPDTEVTVLQVVKLRAKVGAALMPSLISSTLRDAANSGTCIVVLVFTHGTWSSAWPMRQATKALFLPLQHLAALYVLVTSVTSLFLHCAISTVPFVVCGAYSAWFYLRFFQPSPTDPGQQCAQLPLASAATAPLLCCCKQA